jgi:hypothetical protein
MGGEPIQTGIEFNVILLSMKTKKKHIFLKKSILSKK